MMSPLSLAGKHCVVVGGTGVIGSHIAKAFARHGAVLTILGRTALEARKTLEPQFHSFERAPAPLEDAEVETAAAVATTARPTSHRFIPLDVSQRAQLKSVFAGKDKAGLDSEASQDQSVGLVDVLVNCAGISQTTAMARLSESSMDKILETNLTATMLACKYARMRSHGCIINVSSLMATKAGRGAAAYAASKAGVIGFTRAFCLETSARSIRINALLPGWVESPMWTDLKPDLQAEYLSQIPLRRAARPEEVAEAAVFLATNAYANNCVLNLDGGMSAS